VGAANESSNATGINGDEGNNSAPGTGAVYVFQRVGTAWPQQAYIKGANVTFAGFGRSVALSGDTLAVGASSDSGVYVFRRNGAIWTQQARISGTSITPPTTNDDAFGYAVAVSNDTLVVGAPYVDLSTVAGAVYVFQWTGTVWAQQAYLRAPIPGSDDYFGGSIALSGDTLVVSASGEDSSATGIDGNQADDHAGSSGAVYVFHRTGVVWEQQTYIKASNTGAGDGFGSTVALSGDLLAITATGESSSATGVNGDPTNDNLSGSGAVYVFRRNGPSWEQRSYIKASNTGKGDNFGWAVALSGDTLAVGAALEASNATGIDGNPANDDVSRAGAAYVFR
jgi:hypothetical protein